MNRLKELRTEKKLTQKELADIIGVSKITILRWENDERQIKPDKAQALADYFGVPVGYLLGYSGKSLSISGNLKAGDKINLRGTVATIDETLILFQTETGYTIWLNREAVEKSSERRSE
ncbi:helix-turn-helix transcriptional regulator [Streptococcus mitis]|nr:helix-turn-helix transcriptional regulator [Streptococcus sp. NLN76]